VTAVMVCGPNLRTPDHQTFHVHGAGCADLRKYGPHRVFGGETPEPGEYPSLQALIEDWYGDQIAENQAEDASSQWASWEAYGEDFRVFPCVDFTNQPTNQPNPTKEAAMADNTTTTKAAKILAATECACGCGATTARAFAAGHDNRLYGQVRRGEKPREALAPYPGLVRKLEWADRKDAAKAQRKAEQAETEAATTPTAERVAQYSQVKIGRWTHDLVSVEPIDDGLVRVTYLSKGGEKTANVPPKALIEASV